MFTGEFDIQLELHVAFVENDKIANVYAAREKIADYMRGLVLNRYVPFRLDLGDYSCTESHKHQESEQPEAPEGEPNGCAK